MANNKNVIGMEAIYFGDIPADGGVATVFEEIGETVIDSVSLSRAEVTTTEIGIEESDDPLFSVDTGGGGYTLTGASYNISPERLVEFLGGTVTGTGADTQWNAPAKSPTIYKSVKVVAPGGYTATMARVKLNVVVTWNFQKSNPAQLTYTGIVMTPTKVGVAKLTTGAPSIPVG